MKHMKNHYSVLVMFAMITGMVVQSCQVDNGTSENGLYFNGKHYTQEELNNEAKRISKKDILNAINNKLGIEKVSDVTGKSEVLKTLKLKALTYKITEYRFKDIGKHLYIAQDNYDPNSYRVFKTFQKDGKKSVVGEKEVKYDKLINARYSKEYGGLKLPTLASLFTLNTANAELCQRQAGEMQSECESREYDEFIEDCFACWVAYWTNPPVSLLISALCLCEE